jgi:hypothetical protein
MDSDFSLLKQRVKKRLFAGFVRFLVLLKAKAKSWRVRDFALADR